MLFVTNWEGPSGIRCLAPCLIRRRSLSGRDFGVSKLPLWCRARPLVAS
jgi:hypothetical protein